MSADDIDEDEWDVEKKNVIRVSLTLEQALQLTDAEARQFAGEDEEGGAVKTLPVAREGTSIWVDFGEIPLACYEFDTSKKKVPLGEALRAWAHEICEEAFGTEMYDLGDLEPGGVTIREIYFDPEEELWTMVTEIESAGASPGEPYDTPVTAEEWEALEAQLGVSLPAAMRAFFENRPELEYYRNEPWSRIAPARRLNRTRYLPLFTNPGSDTLGLFYPRGGSGPFAAFDYHSESILCPVTADFEALFANVDHYSDWDLEADESKSVPRDDDGPWTGLLVATEPSGPAEHEFLKPLMLDKGRLEEGIGIVFGDLWSRFGADDPLSVAVQACLPDAAATGLGRSWIDLGDRLLDAGLHQEALTVLENALVVLDLYPHYGQDPGDAEEDALQHSFAMQPEVLDRMEQIAAADGDAFDRATVPSFVAWTRRGLEACAEEVD